METVSGGDPRLQSHGEKKRLHRVPSPARPLLRAPPVKASVPPPKSPSLGHPPTPHSRLSRRNVPAKEKPSPARGSAKTSLSTKRAWHGTGENTGKASNRREPPLLLQGPPSPSTAAGRRSAHTPDTFVRLTDSSSDLSDCPSEPLSDEQRPRPAASSDNESGEQVAGIVLLVGADKRRALPGKHDARRGAHSDPHPCAATPSRGQDDELHRELDELRSENDYLKVGAGMAGKVACLVCS